MTTEQKLEAARLEIAILKRCNAYLQARIDATDSQTRAFANRDQRNAQRRIQREAMR